MALDTIVSHEKLDGIAGAIRSKGGTSAPLTLDQMPAAIQAIPSGSGGGTSPFLEQVLKDPSNSSNDPHDVNLSLAAWGDSSPYSGSAKIRDYAFYNSRGNGGTLVRRLGDVTIPPWIDAIGSYAFQSAGVTNVTFAGSPTDSTLTLGDSSFYNQPSLVSVKGSRCLQFSATQAFASCTGLREVDITLAQWMSVYSLTFYSCTSLSRVILRGGHISEIGASAFSNCTALSELVINENNTSPYLLVSLASDSLNNVPETCRIYVPDAQVDAYKAATNWSVRADNIYPLSLFVEE